VGTNNKNFWLPFGHPANQRSLCPLCPIKPCPYPLGTPKNQFNTKPIMYITGRHHKDSEIQVEVFVKKKITM